uniref:DNA primase n=1 Tax=Acinetobacter phage vB_AbaSt_W16 TaxID=3116434 RepID=A0AB38ZCL5_9CAUD
MSSFIDDEYALQYFSLQRNFKQVGAMPLKLNCSCPVCGDSAKDAFMARFWYYEHKGTKFVHCYNCDYSNSFGMFLREYDEDAFKNYQMAQFKEGAHKTNNRYTQPGKELYVQPKKADVVKHIEKLDYCQRLDTLPKSHPIIKYVEARKIPTEKYNRLWFTSQWQELCNKVKPGTFAKVMPEYRLVIPIFNKDGQIESFQGRALKESRVKYITIKVDEESTKIYGQDTVDESKPVLMLEGPLDSLFLSNACAITGGKLSLDQVPYEGNRIWVMDNECRHEDTLKRMQSLIDAGENVCFWDSAPWPSKDINDMIVKDGATPEQIEDYILNNYASGLMAKVRMMKYRKI